MLAAGETIANRQAIIGFLAAQGGRHHAHRPIFCIGLINPRIELIEAVIKYIFEAINEVINRIIGIGIGTIERRHRHRVGIGVRAIERGNGHRVGVGVCAIERGDGHRVGVGVRAVERNHILGIYISSKITDF